MSTSDFYADKRKTCRRSGYETMGAERWYLTPPGLLANAMLPDGYGVIELHGKRIKVAIKSSISERPGRVNAEMPLLIWAVRSGAWNAGYKGRGVLIECAKKRNE